MRTERRHEKCLNCGTATPSHFCSECGQRNSDLHASFGELVVDLLSEAFEADSRLGRTVVPFLVKPGFLSAEYNAGRRVSYSSPLRLYLFASFVFFLVLGLVPRDPAKGQIKADINFDVDLGADQDGGTRTLQYHRAVQLGGTGDAGTADGGARAGEGIDGPPDAGQSVSLSERAEARLREFEAQSPERRSERVGKFLDDLQANTSKAVFALVPVFALFLKLVYRRQRRFYVEHLTFAFHVHAFAFLVLTPALLWRRLEGPLLLAVLVYLFFALLRVHGQGVVKTSIKLLLLAFLQAVAVVLVLLGAVGATFLVTLLA